jgi:hypothetical protein
MSIETRPSSNEAFAERLRNAEARKQEEIDSPRKRSVAVNMKAVNRRRDLEEAIAMRRIEKQHKEVWED